MSSGEIKCLDGMYEMSGWDGMSGRAQCTIILQAIFGDKQGGEMPESMDSWMCFSLSNEVSHNYTV